MLVLFSIIYSNTVLGGETLSNSRKVVKFRRQRSINIGIVIFVILFIYITINVYIYFTKEHLSIYEVKEGSNVVDNKVTGLILRDEKLITTNKAGYISYFQKEGSRIAKNATIFSVDDSMQIMEVITNSDTPIKLSDESNAQFKYELEKFHNYYSDQNFTPVYGFKEEAQSTVMDLLNVTMIEKGQQIQLDTGFAYNYEVVSSAESGIVSYYIDQYESITEDMVSIDMFNEDNYSKIPLRSTEMITQGSPVYKLVTSEKWTIILSLSSEQYEKLSSKDKIRFTIMKDEFETIAPIHLFQRGANYFARLSMDKHMINYLQDRFLTIELHLDADKGLKIPLSAIVEKDFYLVPLEYFTVGGDSGKEGLVKESYNENGEVNLSFIPTDKYYEDETYGYVDTRLFSSGTWIKSTTGADRFQLLQTAKLTGVYNVNMGYAVFKRIDVLYQNEAYCIIKKNTQYGLSLYDHIALDGKTAIEQAIIY